MHLVTTMLRRCSPLAALLSAIAAGSGNVAAAATPSENISIAAQAPALPADTARTLYSLPTCLHLLLDNAYSIRLARNSEAIAANNATRGNAGMLPKVNATAGFGGDVNQLQHAGGKPYTNTHNESYNAGISASWTLFDGWGMQASYHRLQEVKKNGELSTKLEIESSMAQAAAMYYELLQRRLRLVNLRTTLAMSRERLRIANEKYLVGSHSQLELLQAQVDFNADSSQLVTYLQGTIEQQIRFKKLLLLPFDRSEVDFADSSFNLNEHLDFGLLKEQALQQNTSLQIYSVQREITYYERKQVEAARYPYVNLSASYGYAGSRTGYSGSKGDELGLTYGVSAGFKLYDGSNQRRLERNARVERDNREIECQRQMQQVLSDLYILFSSYRAYISLLSLERANCTLANRKVALAMEQYRLGQISSLELREHQRTHLDAQDRLLNAELQAKLSEIYIMQLCGTILTYLEN